MKAGLGINNKLWLSTSGTTVEFIKGNMMDVKSVRK